MAVCRPAFLVIFFYVILPKSLRARPLTWSTVQMSRADNKGYPRLRAHQPDDQEDNQLKSTFSNIYTHDLWGKSGRGSGSGSSIPVTELTRAAIRITAANYSLHSMIDAPCGMFSWPRIENNFGTLEASNSQHT